MLKMELLFCGWLGLVIKDLVVLLLLFDIQSESGYLEVVHDLCISMYMYMKQT